MPLASDATVGRKSSAVSEMTEALEPQVEVTANVPT